MGLYNLELKLASVRLCSSFGKHYCVNGTAILFFNQRIKLSLAGVNTCFKTLFLILKTDVIPNGRFIQQLYVL